MSNIVDELLESFRTSSEKLHDLSEGLEELQRAQKLVEELSSNLTVSAEALRSTANAHGHFIQSANSTNEQLGDVINILKNLDANSINSKLSKLSSDIDENKLKLTELSTSLSAAESKASATEGMIEKISKQLEAVSASNISLARQLSDAQQALLKRIDSSEDNTNKKARGRHKTNFLFTLIALVLLAIILGKLLNFLPI